MDLLKFDIIEGDGKMQGKRDMQGTQELVGIDLSYVGLMTIVPPSCKGIVSKFHF